MHKPLAQSGNKLRESWRYFVNKINFGKGEKAKNIKRIRKTYFNFYPTVLAKIKNIHHTLTPCLLCLDCPETRTVEVYSHVPRKPVFSLNYSLQLTHIISPIVGGSEIEVASFRNISLYFYCAILTVHTDFLTFLHLHSQG